MAGRVRAARDAARPVVYVECGPVVDSGAIRASRYCICAQTIVHSSKRNKVALGAIRTTCIKTRGPIHIRACVEVNRSRIPASWDYVSTVGRKGGGGVVVYGQCVEASCKSANRPKRDDVSNRSVVYRTRVDATSKKDWASAIIVGGNGVVGRRATIGTASSDARAIIDYCK